MPIVSVGEFWRLKSPHRRTGNRTIVRVESIVDNSVRTVNLSHNRLDEYTTGWCPNYATHRLENFVSRYEWIDGSELPDYWRLFNSGETDGLYQHTPRTERPDYRLDIERLENFIRQVDTMYRPWSSELQPKLKTKRKTGFGKFVSKLEEQSNGSNNPSSS